MKKILAIIIKEVASKSQEEVYQETWVRTDEISINQNETAKAIIEEELNDHSLYYKFIIILAILATISYLGFGIVYYLRNYLCHFITS